MTRIVAGAWGGRTLTVPRTGTRPTSERVREAVFSRLDSLDAVTSARVLDVFAGSGALGLEALSRGGATAVFVDSSREAAKVLQRNIVSLGCENRSRIVVADASHFTGSLGAGEYFDLIFLDPPYALNATLVSRVLAGLASHLDSAGIMILESSKRYPRPDFPPLLMDSGGKVYGDTLITYLRPVSPQQPQVGQENSPDDSNLQ